MTPSLLAALTNATTNGPPALLATRMADGAQFLLPDPAAPAALLRHAAHASSPDFAQLVHIDGEPWFLQRHAPPPRLLIIGAVHIAQALAPVARLSGFTPTVIDPRRGFATPERLPGTTLLTAWPDEALPTLSLDDRTALVALTHDPKIDDPALIAALRSPCFYIGALGSRKTHTSRLQRLAEAGTPRPDLAKIRGPVGLAIGAANPAEIAISITAEIIAAYRQAKLADRAAPPAPPLATAAA
jgi:xanthine dehydrogenase accessory factor